MICIASVMYCIHRLQPHSFLLLRTVSCIMLVSIHFLSFFLLLSAFPNQQTDTWHVSTLSSCLCFSLRISSSSLYNNLTDSCSNQVLSPSSFTLRLRCTFECLLELYVLTVLTRAVRSNSNRKTSSDPITFSGISRLDQPSKAVSHKF